MAPKISCICVSQKGVEALKNAIIYFEEQTYDNKELVVIYPKADEAIRALENQHIANKDYIFLPIAELTTISSGEQNRLALDISNGDYIAVWNDGDSYAPDRLSQQLEFMLFMKQPANALASITLYNQTTADAYVTSARENGWTKTMICERKTLEVLCDNKTTDVASALIAAKSLSIIEAPELYIHVIGPEVDPRFSNSEKLSAEEAELIRKRVIGAKKIYDGVLSLGAWCQVGAAISILGLTHINSPIHNFGVKTWKNLIDILESGFENYWERDNMVIGKPEEGYSAQYEDNRPVYKVYCNNYNMISNHHFDVVDNTPEELRTYDAFKQKIEVLSAIFQIQCQRYERVLFGCKVMSAPEATVIEKEDLLRLCRVLDELRDGKPYDLKISVPKDQYEKVLHWLFEENLKHVSIYPWTIEWNNDVQDEEWQWMFGDAKLADNYFERLNLDIMGMEEISYEHIRYLNS